jgi:hypothetical protein
MLMIWIIWLLFDRIITLEVIDRIDLNVDGLIQGDNYNKNCRLNNSFLYQTHITAQATYNIPSYQIDALEDLYNSTNGWNWNWKEPERLFGSKWYFSEANPNPCVEGWQGITCSTVCSRTSCGVIEIVLGGYDLDGTLPMTLGNITTLTVLEIYSNHF